MRIGMTNINRAPRQPSWLLPLSLSLTAMLVMVSAQQSQQSSQASIRIDDNNLVIAPPQAGRVLMNQVDIRALSASIDALAVNANSALSNSNAKLEADVSMVVSASKNHTLLLATSLSIAAATNSSAQSQLTTLPASLEIQQTTISVIESRAEVSASANQNQLASLVNDSLDQTAAYRAVSCLLSSGPYNFSTTGALAWASFNLRGVTHVMVLNHQDDSSYSVLSSIYRWSTTKRGFVLWQEIPTLGARHANSFDMGSYSYLAIVNSKNSTTNSAINSEILRYNATLDQFVHFQYILTSVGHASAFFSRGSSSFLFFSNHVFGTAYAIDSVLLRFDSEQQLFVTHQAVPTRGAAAVEVFEMANHIYLTIGNMFDESVGAKVQSVVMAFNDTTQQLSLFQTFNTTSGSQLKPFVVAAVTHLAIVNKDSTSQAAVYRFNATAQAFVLLQLLASTTAFGVDVAHIGGVSYLFLTNNPTTQFFNVSSELFRWDEATDRFVSHQRIKTYRAGRPRFFTMGVDTFLAVPNHVDSNNRFRGTSYIYKWCGSQLVVV